MTYDQIKSKVYFLTKTNSTSFPIADLTILANNALERVASLIISLDGRWQWDDSNQTDLPIATTALVSGQQDYSLSVDHLTILGVELKDQNGNWIGLTPIDQNDIKYNPSITDFMEGGGIPQYYDKLGTSIFLYPIPNYSQSASLKIRYQRAPSYFTTGDTTKTPGFNALYHDLLPLWVAYEYAFANSMANTNKILEEINRKEEAMKSDYQMRGKDEPLKLRVKSYSSR
jgi:hypothetical protein